MILVYTGDGKGKTCACVGQALRAIGSGLDTIFAQFMKRPDRAGEQALLSRLLGDSYRASGPGFFRSEEDREQHRKLALELLEWALAQGADMTILDEAIYALRRDLLRREEVEPFLAECSRSKYAHATLSGRGAPAWLLAMADTATEMRPLAHHFSKGFSALPGLEY